MTTATNNKINLEADDLIECILQRKGGTIVEFGFHAKKKVKYHFQPLNPLDPDSPHVCNVPNDDHYDRLLNIPEAYRAFDPDEEYEPVLAAPAPSDDDDFDPRNDFSDLLSVNPEDVSNDWLGKFAETILGIKISQKQKLADVATKQYGLEFDYKTTSAVDIVRLILVERIEQERNVSDNV
ncbi:TPA: hypothetical protein ACVB8O_002146 [Acinetobacter baumannii]